MFVVSMARSFLISDLIPPKMRRQPFYEVFPGPWRLVSLKPFYSLDDNTPNLPARNMESEGVISLIIFTFQ